MKNQGVAVHAIPFSSLDCRKIVVVVFFDQVELRLPPLALQVRPVYFKCPAFLSNFVMLSFIGIKKSS